MALRRVGHHPIHSSGGYASGPGLNASCRFGCRALHDSSRGSRMSINQ